MASNCDAVREFLFDSDSDDEDFEGFRPEDIAESESDDEEDVPIARLGDPEVGSYSHSWLKEFSCRSGPLVHDEHSSPYDIFSYFFDFALFQFMVTQTNRYADETIQSKGGQENMSAFSRLRKWVPTTVPEMRAFVALLLLMGLIREPNYDLYWSMNFLIQLPGLRSVMSRDRFYLLLQSFHLCCNADAHPRDHPQHDRLHKLRHVISTLIGSWQSAYHPSRDCSIDESIIAFKGRCSMIMYKPNKPHKWGLNAWALCESSSGYVFNWELYQGRQNDGPQVGLTHDVVMRLSSPLYQQGHHLYMDNYFTSPDLFASLADEQIGACGTLRVNRRGTPDAIKNAHMVKGSPPVTVRDGLLQFITWCDMRTVSILTTVHNTTTFQKQVRSRHNPGNVRRVEKPKAIELYSKKMGGVDRADQSLWYALNTHKCLKWWKKVFIYLLELSVVNSWIIYKNFHPEASKHGSEKFRLAICEGLLEGYERQNVRAGRPPSNPPARLTERHFPAAVGLATQSGRKSFPDCVVCSDRKEGRRHQVSFKCAQCQKPMCPAPCFERYHTLKDFKIRCPHKKFGSED